MNTGTKCGNKLKYKNMYRKKILLLAVTCVCLNFQVSGQTDTTGQIAMKYKRVYLSVSAGKDYPVGTSSGAGFIFNEENNRYPVPFTSGFGASFSGAYFFSRNYGAGMKYYFYSAGFDDKETFDHDNEFAQYSFDEMTHFVGAAIYGRWTPGRSKWEITADIAAGYVQNKLSNMWARIYNWMYESGRRQGVPKVYSIENITGNTAGIMFSAGIRYRITSVIGIGVFGHGMFASLSRQVSKNGNNTSRTLNRIGISTGLNFNF